MSVPTIVDRTGVAERLVVPLDDDERAALEASAAEIRATGAAVGL
jgi:malate/lactate dehydrogenase